MQNTKQQTITFNGPVRKVVNCNNYNDGPEQSKDQTVRFRMEPRHADQLKAFCYDRGITISDYIRTLLEMGDEYFDYIDVLKHDKHLIISLLNRLSKKF